MSVQISVTEYIDAPAARVFDTAASIDARTLIQKHGPLPAILDVDGHDAPWSTIGEVRRHKLSDKSSVREELIGFTPEKTFAYRLTEFTGLFAPLVAEARADWHFTQRASGRTRIDWTYVFTPAGALAEPFLWFIVKLFWPGYLKSALARVKEKAEQDEAPSSAARQENDI
ncbi:SRPBCC family protein [Hyphococcus luteus]|uniref:SRPBCC family protein n=1 Tax=Hyphococcus luteus TaxID=2058213 RepID=A0A2S7K0T3_9PROT|nr:SRPBCC family protein [Marinicaulis flavus]PQA86125.1 hypothetical protein CW354_17345 [Marinicaulis flavus]